MLSVFGVAALGCGRLITSGFAVRFAGGSLTQSIVMKSSSLYFLHYRLEKKDRQYQVEEYGYE